MKKDELLYFDKISRRMFIKGVGGGLVAFPVLESFLGEKAYASTLNNKRFVAISTPDLLPYSYLTPRNLKKDLPANYQSVVKKLKDEFGWNYRKVSLEDVISRQGQISELLDSKFNALASKILLYRGVDVPGRTDHGRAASMGRNFRKLGMKKEA